MTEAAAPAVELALALLRSPGRTAACRQQRLPHDTLPLIRIAAGDQESLRQASQATGRPDGEIIEAATFFIQQVLFAPEADSYRVLGVDPDWPTERIKEHYRWLVRWLHPDRNPDAWVALFADRVNRAWQDLRVDARRQTYDRERARPVAPVESSAVAGKYVAPIADAGWAPVVAAPPRLSARAVRRLPLIVLGSLAVGATAVLMLAYYLNQESPSAAIDVSDAGEPVALSPASTAATAAPPPVAAAVVTPPPPAAIPAAPSRKGPPPAVTPVAPSRSVPPHVAQLRTAPAATAQPRGPKAAPLKALPAAAPAAVVAALAPASLPASSPAPAAPAPASPSAPDATATSVAVAAAAPMARPDFDDLLRRFRGAYASGDLGKLQSLLTESDKASDERTQLLLHYGGLFASSASRYIEISQPSWIARGDHVVLVASYNSWLMATHGGEVRHVAGDIRFDLVAQAGEWRISHLSQDERRHD